MQQRSHFIFAVAAYDTVSVNEGYVIFDYKFLMQVNTCYVQLKYLYLFSRD